MLEIASDIEHPQRRQLNDEVHARPPDSIATPAALAYVVRLHDKHDVDAVALLSDLMRRLGQDLPGDGVKHLARDIGSIRLRWERHTEYSRYTFVSQKAADEPFAPIWSEAIPEGWLERCTQQVLVGVHACVVSYDEGLERIEAISEEYFDGNVLIGSMVADGRAIALTDLRIRGDGFTRVLVINEAMPAAQTGRVVQRLLEIETYRMMALLALPVAQELTPVLDEDERELSDIGEALIDAATQQEQALLDRLTRLSARSQNRRLRSNYRFAAADAYYEIVLQRIHELREQRIPGLQTFEEFTTRRLAPAVKTFRAVSNRQQSILEQMARATKLLSTRIDIDRQQQNQSLLASMNRRVKAQLRLQATVEGLSVAAVTYYVVGLVGTLAEGLKPFGLTLDKAVVMGASIPLVASVAFLGVRRLRKKISEEDAH